MSRTQNIVQHSLDYQNNPFGPQKATKKTQDLDKKKKNQNY